MKSVGKVNARAKKTPVLGVSANVGQLLRIFYLVESEIDGQEVKEVICIRGLASCKLKSISQPFPVIDLAPVEDLEGLLSFLRDQDKGPFDMQEYISQACKLGASYEDTQEDFLRAIKEAKRNVQEK